MDGDRRLSTGIPEVMQNGLMLRGDVFCGQGTLDAIAGGNDIENAALVRDMGPITLAETNSRQGVKNCRIGKKDSDAKRRDFLAHGTTR
jgi:hypothetical protein